MQSNLNTEPDKEDLEVEDVDDVDEEDEVEDITEDTESMVHVEELNTMMELYSTEEKENLLKTKQSWKRHI